MRVLLIHTDHFEYHTKDKAIKNPEQITQDNKEATMDEALIAFCTIEKDDEKNPKEISKRASDSIKEVAELVKTKNIMIYPYAHLSSNLGSADIAIPLLEDLEKELQDGGYIVKRSPFGYYKKFNMTCKGHPLSELSRNIVAEKKEKKTKPIKTTYKVLKTDGKVVSPEEYSQKPDNEEFNALVMKEALKKELPGGEPKFLEFCKKFGIEWEPHSDVGHMRYGPEGALIFDLIGDYAWSIANSLGFPILQVKGTNMFDLATRPVKEHADLFGDRLYALEVEGKELVLRYAACHQQFSSVKDWTLSYRQLPFGTFEIADSYRLEQSGELLLCFRVRKLHMPDLHIYCSDLDNSKNVSIKTHKKIYNEIKKLGRDYVSIYNTTETFFNEHRDFFEELLKIEAKPILLNFVPDGVYYWLLNVEYAIIDKLNRPREIATFQIDVGNAKRFDISFTSQDGSKIYPVIIHTALIGTIERYLYTLFDSAVFDEHKGKKPMLPIWLSPTQVRILPMSKDFLKKSEEIRHTIEKAGIRVDIDDREETLEKRVRDAEVKWVPYIIIIGQKEIDSNNLSVRVRSKKKSEQIDTDGLIKQVKAEIDGYPFRDLTIPRLVSKRPGYR